MEWLRRISLALGLAAALGMVFLDWELVANLQRFSRDARHVEDLQILAILLFGIAGLYSILFLVAPFLSAQVMKRQSDRTIACIKDQLRMTISELRELRVPAASESTAHSSQYRQLAGRIQYVNAEMAQVYRSLGVLFASRDVESARAHFYQALALSTEPSVTAEIHYTFACVLARHHHLDEASEELEAAFAQADRIVAEMLAKDIEEGGPLCALANTEPFDFQVNRLLMSVSVGL